jgi:hypothetical protein
LVVWECGIKHAADRMEEIPDFILSDQTQRQWPEHPPRIRVTNRDKACHSG